jgi:hypothetical protein
MEAFRALGPFLAVAAASIITLHHRAAGASDAPCGSPLAGTPRPVASARRPVREVGLPEAKACLAGAVAAFLASSDASELGRAVRELFVAGAEDSPAARGAAAPAAGALAAGAWSPADPPSPGSPLPEGSSPLAAQPGAAAASRALLTSELTKICVYAACEKGGEAGERLCSALAQLTLTGQLSPGGAAHALRVLAARLSQLRRDYPCALRSLAAFAAWLAECGAAPEDALEARGPAAEAAFEEAARALGWAVGGGGGEGGAVTHAPPPAAALAADVLEVATAVRQLLRSRAPSQLSQVRAMYGEALTAYLRSGGAGFPAMVRTLAEMGAQWTRNELARALLRAFLSPPWAHVGALQLEGGPGSDGEDAGGGCGSEARDHAAFAADMPIWAVHELCVGLLLELHGRSLVDSLAVAAAAEATLRDLPDLCVDVEDAPGLLGAALLKLCAEGALPEGWLEGKHASLGGLTFSAAAAARGGGSRGGASPAGNPSGVTTPDAAGTPAAPPPQPPLPQPSPALGPLPDNAWAGHVSAARSGGGGGGASATAAAASAPPAWVAVATFAAASAPPELPPLELPPASAPAGAARGAAPHSGALSPARSPLASFGGRSPPARSPVASLKLPLPYAPVDVWETRAPAMLALALAGACLRGEGGGGGGWGGGGEPEPGLRETLPRLKRLGLLSGAATLRGSALTVGELCAGARAAGEALGAAAALPGGGSATGGLQGFSTALLGLGGDWARLLANEAVRAAVWRAAAAASGGADGGAGAGHRVALALAGLHRRGVLRARCIRLGIARACEDVALPGLARDGALRFAPRGEREAARALLPHAIATLGALNGGAALGGRPFFPAALPEALAGELEEEEEEGEGGEGVIAALARATEAIAAVKGKEAAGLAVP